MEKARKIHTDFGAETGLSFLYTLLSLIYCDSNDLDLALKYAEEALELSQSVKEINAEMWSSVYLGRILGKKDSNKNKKAEEYILQGIKLAEELKTRPFLSQGYLFLGELYVDGSQKEKAMESLKKAEVEFKDMAMDYWLGRTYVVYADLYKKGGETSKAKENLNKAIEFLKKCGADGWAKKYEKELAGLS